MNTTELQEILEAHKNWLAGKDCGKRANLSGANLSVANLFRADLSGANLFRTDLFRADLSGANLSGANLSGANLFEAYLSRADLFEADLSGADLSGADLSGANLSGANLSEAYLSRADLSGANLSGVNLSESCGITFADCCFSSHGECGRRLLAVLIGETVTYFCGCFRGTEAELHAYIEAGRPGFKESRTAAFDFVRGAMAFQMRKMAENTKL